MNESDESNKLLRDDGFVGVKVEDERRRSPGGP